jgi:hypothetical protein
MFTLATMDDFSFHCFIHFHGSEGHITVTACPLTKEITTTTTTITTTIKFDSFIMGGE